MKELLRELRDEREEKKRPAELSEMERETVKIQKVQATAALMETYLKFQHAGVPLPAMFQKVVDEGL